MENLKNIFKKIYMHIFIFLKRLSKLSIKPFSFICRNLVKLFDKMAIDHVTAFSSEAALFTIISFFPFVMLFLTLLNYTPLNPDFIMRLINDSLPTEITNFIETIINEIFKPSATLLSISAIAALWSASKGFLSIFRGFNVIYKTGETRNYLIIRVISILYTLGFAVLLMLTLIFLVFGNYIYRLIISHFPFIKDLALLIISIRATVLLFLLFVFFLIMYIVIPNRKTTLLNELPGALISSSGWILFSYAYAYYIDNLTNFTYMYGSLTAIVLLLIWMYSCMYILLLGAEINAIFGLKIANRIKKDTKKVTKPKVLFKLAKRSVKRHI
ncbi:MAG: YihY/virulence factor BrkB family protein [Lachnospiraceae bacterium]|nr:YihY/virulence factor BrkB family protein [Lachnospiraceae bacterium]